MAARITRRSKALLSANLHPHYAQTARALAGPAGLAVTRGPALLDDAPALIRKLDGDTACVVVQTPDVFGRASEVSAIAKAAHAVGALLVVVVTEVVSLGLLKPPGEMGADIVVAEGQSLGNGLNFGGPYVGLFATHEKYLRQMPGRLCGETVDAQGRRGFVLTLSTREQHIRRDKATSNICTNAGLCALAFSIHLTLLGQEGLRRLALLNHQKARQLKAALESIPGVTVMTDRFFNEIAVHLSGNAADVVDRLAERGILAGVPLSRLAPEAGLGAVLLLAATEMTRDEDIDSLAVALAETLDDMRQAA
jgi:glycine dehydrogenase subunit 1